MEKQESSDDDDDDIQGHNIKKEIKTEPLDVKSRKKKPNSPVKWTKNTSKTSNISEQQPSTSKHTVSQNLTKKWNWEKLLQKIASRTRISFIFCQIFAIIDDFSQWSAPRNCSGTLKNHQIWGKYEEKPCSTCLKWLNTFFGWFWVRVRVMQVLELCTRLWGQRFWAARTF